MRYWSRASVADSRSSDGCVGRQGGTSPSPAHLGITYMWKWKTSCHPAGRFDCVTLSPSGVSRSSSTCATRFTIVITAHASISDTDQMSAAWVLGTTRVWPSLAGLRVKEGNGPIVLCDNEGERVASDNPAEDAIAFYPPQCARSGAGGAVPIGDLLVIKTAGQCHRTRA